MAAADTGGEDAATSCWWRRHRLFNGVLRGEQPRRVQSPKCNLPPGRPAESRDYGGGAPPPPVAIVTPGHVTAARNRERLPCSARSRRERTPQLCRGLSPPGEPDSPPRSPALSGPQSHWQGREALSPAPPAGQPPREQPKCSPPRRRGPRWQQGRPPEPAGGPRGCTAPGGHAAGPGHRGAQALRPPARPARGARGYLML